MDYFLRQRYIGPQTMVEIDEARYELLTNARRTLVDAGAFEQRYEMLLGNFTAFEMFCAETSLRGSIELDFRYEAWAHAISEANRHAMNALTTARQFADQVVRDFAHLDLPERFEAAAKRLLSEAYDGTLEYKVVWELRNYVQHRAIAVHGIKGRPNEAPWTEASMIYCQKKNILEDRGRFKKKVLDQLDDHVDILMMFRGYMAAVSSVQIALRKLIEQHCIDARSAVQKAMNDFASVQKGDEYSSGKVVGLTAVMREDGIFSNEVLLFLNWDDARVALGDKNSKQIVVNSPK